MSGPYDSLPYGPLPWHVGPTSPRNIYDADNEPVTTMSSQVLAEMVVAAVNALAQGEGAKALVEGWLVKDFNALYRAAKNAAQTLTPETIGDLESQLARLAPAFRLTEGVRQWAQTHDNSNAPLPPR